MTTQRIHFTYVRDKESVIGPQGSWMPCTGGERVRVEAPRRRRAALGGTCRGGRGDVAPIPRLSVRRPAQATDEPLHQASTNPGGKKA